MKKIFTLLIFAQVPLILADIPKYTGQEATKTSQAPSRHLKTLISQKLIQNVLKTVEILKQRNETTYRQKKDKLTQKHSI